MQNNKGYKAHSLASKGDHAILAKICVHKESTCFHSKSQFSVSHAIMEIIVCVKSSVSSNT